MNKPPSYSLPSNKYEHRLSMITEIRPAQQSCVLTLTEGLLFLSSSTHSKPSLPHLVHPIKMVKTRSIAFSCWTTNPAAQY